MTMTILDALIPDAPEPARPTPSPEAVAATCEEFLAIKPSAEVRPRQNARDRILADGYAAHVAAIHAAENAGRAWRAEQAKALAAEVETTRPLVDERRAFLRAAIARADLLALPHECEGHSPISFEDARVHGASGIANALRRELEGLDLLEELVARRERIAAELRRTERPRGPLGTARLESDSVMLILWRPFAADVAGRELSTDRGVTFVPPDVWGSARRAFAMQRARFGKAADVEVGLALEGAERFDLDRIAVRAFGAHDVEIEQTHREYRKRLILMVSDAALLRTWRERASDAETAQAIDDRLLRIGEVL